MEHTKEQAPKRPYVSPNVTVLGDIESITQGNSQGQYLDATFQIHTHFSQLTFS